MARTGAIRLDLEEIVEKDERALEDAYNRLVDVINRNANSADWVATAPTAAANLAGRMIVVDDGAGGGAGSETDQLKVCMRNGGSWTWRTVTVT